jgi:hypothetical protein
MQLQVHRQTQHYSGYNIPPTGSIGAGSPLHSRTPSWNGVFSTTLCHLAHKDNNSQAVRATSPRAHHSASGFQRSRVSATPWNPQMDHCVLQDVVLTAVSKCRTEGHEKSRNLLHTRVLRSESRMWLCLPTFRASGCAFWVSEVI